MEIISVKVKLFAAYQEAFQQGELEFKIASGTSIRKVFDDLIEQKPELEKWRDLTRFGVNFAFVGADTILRDGDELVFIPPVSGG